MTIQEAIQILKEENLSVYLDPFGGYVICKVDERGYFTSRHAVPENEIIEMAQYIVKGE